VSVLVDVVYLARLAREEVEREEAS
jgi:hypothetical protein